MISRSVKRPTAHALVFAILALLAAAAAFGSSAEARRGLHAAENGQASAALTVRSTKYGRILSDGRGRALYAFTRDRRGGRSRCYNACAKAWPVFVGSG